FVSILALGDPAKLSSLRITGFATVRLPRPLRYEAQMPGWLKPRPSRPELTCWHLVRKTPLSKTVNRVRLLCSARKKSSYENLQQDFLRNAGCAVCGCCFGGAKEFPTRRKRGFALLGGVHPGTGCRYYQPGSERTQCSPRRHGAV